MKWSATAATMTSKTSLCNANASATQPTYLALSAGRHKHSNEIERGLRMRFLEERAETLVLLDDSNDVRVLAKDAYTEVKYKMFAGKRIRYVATDGTHVTRIEENEECTEFLCDFEGREVRVNDRLSIARAIIDHATRGDISPLVRLLKWWTFTQDLCLSVDNQSNRLEPHQRRNPPLASSVSPEVLDRATYHDGSKVAKLLFTLKDRNNWLYGMFRNHDYAVALVGRDEIGQPWMHYLPPVYRERAIVECEGWLAGGAAGDNIVF